MCNSASLIAQDLSPIELAHMPRMWIGWLERDEFNDALRQHGHSEQRIADTWEAMAVEAWNRYSLWWDGDAAVPWSERAMAIRMDVDAFYVRVQDIDIHLEDLMETIGKPTTSTSQWLNGFDEYNMHGRLSVHADQGTASSAID